MNYLKDYCQSERLKVVVAYCDNNALGFFKKHGFSEKYIVPVGVFWNRIQHFDNATLMHSRVYHVVDYKNLKENI
jgi:hypothetical protein